MNNVPMDMDLLEQLLRELPPRPVVRDVPTRAGGPMYGVPTQYQEDLRKRVLDSLLNPMETRDAGNQSFPPQYEGEDLLY